MGRGRKRFEIDKTVLATMIADAESKNNFENRNELFEYLAGQLSVSTTTVYNKTKEHGLVDSIKTEKGKKGVFNTTVTKVPRGDKYKSEAGKKHIAALRKRWGHKYNKLIGQIEAGSMKAAVKMNCIECTCDQSVEIKECQILACPLWMLRPYK